MTFEEIRVLIPQYLSGQLTASEHALFEAKLSESAELRRELEEFRSIWEGLGRIAEEEPSPAMRARFYQRLNAIERGRDRNAQGWFSWWTPARALQAIAALGIFFAGIYVGRLNESKPVTAGEVAQLRAQVQGLHETVALSLLERQSAASRLEGISWGSRVEQPDQELLSALVTALNRDPNTNVRLASLDALEKFSGDGGVRKALVASLSVQDSPLVQIALIDALVHVHANTAAAQLRKLTTDQELNAAVRQRAQWGLEKLTYQ